MAKDLVEEVSAEGDRGTPEGMLGGVAWGPPEDVAWAQRGLSDGAERQRLTRSSPGAGQVARNVRAMNMVRDYREAAWAVGRLLAHCPSRGEDERLQSALLSARILS